MLTRSGERVVKTICGFCHTNCGMLAYVKEGRPDRVRGNPEHPANGGHLCPKGLAAREVAYSPQHLTVPLKMVGRDFQEIPWHEALDTVANRLTEIRERHGARRLVLCMGAPFTEENKDGFYQLLSAYGSPNRASTFPLSPGLTPFSDLSFLAPF